jgi:beta-barrel assembly-enhancing protease
LYRHFLGACLALAVSACVSTVTPTHREQPGAQANAADEAQLVSTANEIDRRIAGREELQSDAALDAYLQSIAHKLMKAAQAPDTLSIKARALKTNSPDAFVLANGSLYVSRGLLARLETEGQLATVMGREVIHFVNRDQLRAQRYERNQPMETLAPNLFLIMITAGLAGAPINNSIQDAINGYSEQLEVEADKTLVSLLSSAGYSPREGPATYRRLKLESPAKGTSYGTKLTREATLDTRAASMEAEVAKAGEAASTPAESPSSEEWSKQLRAVRWQLAVEAVDDRRYPFATKMLDQYVAIAPPSGRVHWLRALIAQRSASGFSGDAGAMPEFLKATSLADGPVEAYRELGLIYRRQGDSAKANEAFRQYLAKRPNAPDAPFIKAYLEEKR